MNDKKRLKTVRNLMKILTSNPSWGEPKAVIYGAEFINIKCLIHQFDNAVTDEERLLVATRLVSILDKVVR